MPQTKLTLSPDNNTSSSSSYNFPITFQMYWPKGITYNLFYLLAASLFIFYNDLIQLLQI